MTEVEPGDTLEVVVEPVHYGAGVRTFPLAAAPQDALLTGDDAPSGVVMEPSFDAAIRYWAARGWTQPQVIDDAFGRYIVRLYRDDAAE